MSDRLIRPIPGDSIDRAAWSLDYLARTVYFNGYWRHFRPEKVAKRRLNQAGAFGDREAIAAALRSGTSPIDLAIARMEAMGMAHLDDADRAPFLEQWQVVEATLNARLRLAFALADAAALGQAFERLLPGIGPLGALSLGAVERERDEKKKYGIPDVILAGEGAVLLIEMKVRGLTSARKYDPKQLLQYMNLAADQLAASAGAPGRVVHLLLSPVHGGAPCWKPRAWWPAEIPADRRIEVRPETLRTLAAGIKWAPVFDLDSSLEALERVPVYERDYVDLLPLLPRSAWPQGPHGDVGWQELHTVTRLAEPRRYRN